MESENVKAEWDFADHQPIPSPHITKKKKKILFTVEEAESLHRYIPRTKTVMANLGLETRLLGSHPMFLKP